MTFKNVNWQAIGDDNRKNLIEYYKWIINLATFVLTVSLTLTGLFSNGLRHPRLLVTSWVLLGGCVFIDWLLVKRLTTLPIVLAVPEKYRTWLHGNFLNSMTNVRLHGVLVHRFLQLRPRT